MLRPLCMAVVFAGWAFSAGQVASAMPPSQDLLPQSTVGYLSVSNWQELDKSWQQTQLHELVNDPVMKPFVEDLKAQLDEKWSKSHAKLGISWSELKDLPRGEVSLGVVWPGEGEAVLALLADVTGNVEASQKFLDDLVKRLQEQGAKRTEKKVGGATIVVLDFPKQEGEDKARQTAYVLTADMLIAADKFEVVQEIVGRIKGDAKDTLATVEAYQKVNESCRAEAGELAPHIRWFIDPFGFINSVRASRGPRKREGADVVKVLETQGFKAIRGVGGFVNLATQGYEVVHRTKVFAPPPYDLAMRMMKLPNGGDLAPQAWVPLDVATYATVHIDIQNAFQNFGSLFDQLFGDGEKGVFEDVLESLKTDPNGPQIDVREEIIARLGTRVSVVSDYRLPITVSSQRRVIAIEARDGQTESLADAIARAMRPDPTAKERKFRNHTIWEITPEEGGEGVVDIEIEGLGGEGELDVEEEVTEEEGEFAMPNSAVCVANGHLYFATHVDIIEKVLAKAEDDARLLSEMPDFQQVVSQAEALGAGAGCAFVFSRIDEAMRANYELLKAGKMPEAETGLAKILNGILAPDAPAGAPPRQAEIDASKLPDYQVVRRYLGPMGVWVESVNDGWYVVGAVLPKEATSAAPTTPVEEPAVGRRPGGKVR